MQYYLLVLLIIALIINVSTSKLLYLEAEVEQFGLIDGNFIKANIKGVNPKFVTMQEYNLNGGSNGLEELCITKTYDATMMHFYKGMINKLEFNLRIKEVAGKL